MSEGKLKEKIFEAFVKTVKTEKVKVSLPDITTTYNATPFTDVLNEAKKEFPKLQSFTEDDLTVFLYDHTEVTAWFKKWFGATGDNFDKIYVTAKDGYKAHTTIDEAMR